MKRYIQALPLVLLLSLPVFAMETEQNVLTAQTTETAEEFQNPVYDVPTTYELKEGPEFVTVVAEQSVDLWAAHRINANEELMECARAKKLAPHDLELLSSKIAISSDSPLFVGLADKSYSKALRETDPKKYFKEFFAKATTFHQNHVKARIQKNNNKITKITAQKAKFTAKENKLKNIKLPKDFGKESTKITTDYINAKLKRISEQKPTLDKEILALQKDNVSLKSELPWF